MSSSLSNVGFLRPNVIVEVRGCLHLPPGQTSVLLPSPIRSAIDILMVTAMELVWTVTNSTLNWGCNYIMQISAESILQCKCQFARSGQISVFPYFRPSKMPYGCMPAFAPPLPAAIALSTVAEFVFFMRAATQTLNDDL